MKITRGISSAAVLLLLLGTSAPIYSQSGRQRERQERREDQSKRKQQAEADRKAQAENQRVRQQQAQQQRAEQDARERQDRDRERQQRQLAQAEQRMRQQQEQRAQQDRARQQQQEQAQRREQERFQQQDRARQQQQQREQERFQRDRERQQQQVEQQRREQERGQQERLRLEQQREQDRRREQERDLEARNRPPGWDQGKKVGWGGADVPPGQRLSEQRQRELIELNRRQQEQFRQRFDNDLRRGEEQGRFLQQLHRLQQYRYQQEYLERQRQQRARLWSYRDYDYHRDPYFYTVANYRYKRGGRYYVTSMYGVNLIRDALNHGYAEGYRAGRADRMDGWRFDYRNSFAYRDASLGYFGLYVGPSDYNYYFREGFRRGYEDGYYSRFRYGRSYNNGYSLLDHILSGIFFAVQFR